MQQGFVHATLNQLCVGVDEVWDIVLVMYNTGSQLKRFLVHMCNQRCGVQIVTMESIDTTVHFFRRFSSVRGKNRVSNVVVDYMCEVSTRSYVR